jgi:hypothetical protein
MKRVILTPDGNLIVVNMEIEMNHSKNYAFNQEYNFFKQGNHFFCCLEKKRWFNVIASSQPLSGVPKLLTSIDEVQDMIRVKEIYLQMKEYYNFSQQQAFMQGFFSNSALYTKEQVEKVIDKAIDIAREIYCMTGINSRESETIQLKYTKELLQQLLPPIDAECEIEETETGIKINRTL